MRISYALTGDDNAPAMNDITITIELGLHDMGHLKPWQDENGITYVGIEQFLLNEELLKGVV